MDRFEDEKHILHLGHKCWMDKSERRNADTFFEFSTFYSAFGFWIQDMISKQSRKECRVQQSKGRDQDLSKPFLLVGLAFVQIPRAILQISKL
jgi:hypothetical protein